MAARIFVWLGHPRTASLCGGLADAYGAAAVAAGAEVRRINLEDMSFDPNLAQGYQARMGLEPDLIQWQQAINWATHVAWIYPYWWGGMPAKTKGAIDRAFLPGFAMRYHDKDPWWDKLLKGRTAHVITTGDSPSFYDKLAYRAPGRNQVKRLVLEFSGIKVLRMDHLGTVKGAPHKKIDAWLRLAAQRGEEAARQ